MNTIAWRLNKCGEIGEHARQDEMRSAYRILVEGPEMKKMFWRSRLNSEYNIKCDWRELGCEAVDWFQLAEGISHWREFAK